MLMTIVLSSMSSHLSCVLLLSENMDMALKLLIVGIISVFIVLTIVIWFGKALIALVNRFAPEEQVKASKASASETGGVSERHRRIIEEAVRRITNGKGRVEKIEKR